MPRYSRNAAILAKIETTYGTDAAPTGAANALLVSDLTITPLNANNVDRTLVRPYFGGAEQLVGSASVDCEFSVELVGSGTAGTIEAWDALLQGCGFLTGALLTTPSRVEHTLVTDYSTFKGLTIYYHDDGALHKLLGCRGTVSFDLNVGSRPTMKFKFTGLDGGLTATANPSVTLTAFKTPLVVTDPNTGALVLGGTYATGVISGGTEYISGGIELDLGNQVKFTDLLGTAAASGQSVDLTGRETTGKVMFDLTAANEATFMTNVKTNVTQSVGLVHGTTAGYKILVFAPKVQLVNPRKEDKDGRRLIGYDLRFLPDAGNDELQIVSL